MPSRKTTAFEFSRTNWRVNINVKFQRYMRFVSFWLRLRGIYQNSRRPYQSMVVDSTFYSFSLRIALSRLASCRSTYFSLNACKICCMEMMIWSASAAPKVTFWCERILFMSRCVIEMLDIHYIILPLHFFVGFFPFFLVLGYSVTKRKRMNLNADVRKTCKW